MEWLGHAKIGFTHSTTPRKLKTKDGQETDLLAIAEKITPKCHLNPWLFNGHVQTIWTVTQDDAPSVFYRRQIFNADHDTYRGSFAVDFVTEPWKIDDNGIQQEESELPPRTRNFEEGEFEKMGSEDEKPMLIVLHGLSGGSHEVYLRHTIAPLIETGKWDICVVNSRGCCQTKITTGVLYNARATWDMRQTVKWAKRNFPNRPLFGLGFSLGANILTNYCGEEGEDCLLKAAVAVSNPFNLDVSSQMLQSSLFSKEVYLRAMGGSMKQLALRHEEAIVKDTTVDMERIKKVKYLYEFDAEIHCQSTGYPSVGAYYRDASSSDSVLSVRIPYIAIQATDDPIAVKQALPYGEISRNPNTIMVTTSLGGHIGWFETNGGRWQAKPVCNYLNHMAFEMDLSSMTPLPNETGNHMPFPGSNFDPMRRKLHLTKAE